jgi:hypothetical protein
LDAGKIFVPHELGFGICFLWFFLFAFAFGSAGWFLGIYYYHNPEDEETFNLLE